MGGGGGRVLCRGSVPLSRSIYHRLCKVFYQQVECTQSTEFVSISAARRLSLHLHAGLSFKIGENQKLGTFPS